MNSNKPKISIITATYNAEKALENSILSVLNNIEANYEYIVIDGKSTDSTLDILKKYNNKIDIIISEPDLGIYDALNKGIEFSTGEWILILGSDDEIAPGGIDEALKYFIDGHKIYYGNVRLTSNRKNYGGYFNQIRMMFYNIPHQAIFYPSAYAKKNKYNLKYKSAGDFEYLMRANKNDDYSFQYIPITISIYNNEDGVSSKNEDLEFLKDRLELVKTNFSKKYSYIYIARYYILKLIKIFI